MQWKKLWIFVKKPYRSVSDNLSQLDIDYIVSGMPKSWKMTKRKMSNLT